MVIDGQIEPNSSFTFTVHQNTSIKRIDQYLSSLFPHYSRSFLQQLIADKRVARNGSITTKSSTPLIDNDIITITFPPSRSVEPQAITEKTAAVEIIATTPHFMIIYKPPHLLVHPPSKMSPAITLTDWILQNHQEVAQVGTIDRPGIVHRLDKDTSGIMIITRTNHGHTVFNNSFKQRIIQKTYLAVVAGHPEREGTVDLSIGRDPFNRIKMTTFAHENNEDIIKKHSIKIRNALSSYRVLKYFEHSALVEVKPTTGRTHQIRVHMAAIGHPIIGDETYGSASPLIGRQALHAHRLSFTFDEKDYDFIQELPNDIQELINQSNPISLDY